MCPACLATIGLYAAGGVSAVAGTTLAAVKVLRKRTEPTVANSSTEIQGDDHAAPDDRIEG